MNVLYSSSDSYAFLTGISILSLLQNNQDTETINIYIMDNEISDVNKGRLRDVVYRYNRNIEFFPMPDMKVKTGHELSTYRWNISAFGRLYMASVLPELVDKVLNIDCDTIIIGSLKELWNTDMTGKVVGGMLECMNKRYRYNVGRKEEEPYINSGIILMNLNLVRELCLEDAFSTYIRKYGNSLAYLDQDVLNGTVSSDKMAILPLKYNVLSIYFYANYRQLMKIRRAENFYSENEVQNAINSPRIVHFTTCFLDGLRPWIEGNRHPYRERFLEYKEMSPWKEMPLQKDNRKIFVKLRTRLIQIMPRWILCSIASVLHGVIIPYRNGIKMKKYAQMSK